MKTTTLEQSNTLLKLGLSANTADMYWMETAPDNFTLGVCNSRLEKDMLLKKADYYKMTPAWSLEALLVHMPSICLDNCDKNVWKATLHINDIVGTKYTTAINPLDAAYEMLLLVLEYNHQIA